MNRYVVVNWDYAEMLCRKVAMQILEDSFRPEKIVAVAKGGWFASMILSDYLGVEAISFDLKRKEEVSARSILIVDDFINTGKTIKKVIENVKANEIKTCALLMLQASEFIPDYLGEYISEDVWVIFPWNFVEDLSAIILSTLEKCEQDYWGIKNAMFSEFKLDPLNLEIAQPSRLKEILYILEKRKLVEKFEEADRIYWRLRR
ncbi:MAG: phosphoribosyltransferase family protein [Archaeoglobaceae archaeon]|nr:phosphoribosyltransferase family protein [Archaeoglobaceae archaeon]MDW8118277.1 phosphoribosyltransferase family protein [Archaeoglobaceae archaeon]